jgi:iron complex transport system substrate-binding protein
MKHTRWWVLSLLMASMVMVAGCGEDEQSGGATQTAVRTGTSASAGAFTAFDCDASYPATAPDASAFPVGEKDGTGATVTFDTPPSRIVSLSAAHVEVLYAIGAGGQLLAGDKFSDCPKAADALEHVDSFTPSVEAIAALKPDLVVLAFPNADLQQSLNNVGIKSVLLSIPESVDGTLDQIRQVGRISGHTDEAEAYADGMDQRIDEIKKSVAGKEAPSVYHEVDNTFFTAGPGSFVDDLYKILAAKNIAESTGEPFPQLTQEAIIQAAPEVIILADEDAGENAQTVAARPGWDSVPAVKNQRIYTVDPDIVSRPGPRLIEALETLKKLLYEQSQGTY